MGKTSTPELAGGQRKTKAAMIWKKGWKGWKKLHSFGNNSNKTGESFVLFAGPHLYCAIQVIGNSTLFNRYHKNILKYYYKLHVSSTYTTFTNISRYIYIYEIVL